MVTVCIPTYQRPESLQAVLSNLLGKTDRFDEIMIAVTGDREDSLGEKETPTWRRTKQLLKAFSLADIRITVEAGFSGLMEAKQWFVTYAQNEICLFLDDDAVLGEGYFDLARHFCQDEEVGAVSGVLQTPINYDGYKDWSDRPISVNDEYSNTLLYDHRRKTIQWFDKYQVYMHEDDKIFECEYLIGTALFVMRDLVEIDYEFQRGACAGEEIDFTYNIYQQGYSLLFDTSAICWHLHESKGGMRDKDRSKDQENFDYLVKKWGLGEGIEDRCSHQIEGSE